MRSKCQGRTGFKLFLKLRHNFDYKEKAGKKQNDLISSENFYAKSIALQTEDTH